MVWVNALIAGILLGGFYALLATGLSLMFGVMRIINLAHGDLVVLGGYLIWVISEHTSWSPFLAALVALPAMAVLGYLIQVLFLERSLRSGVLIPLLTTFGLSIVIENVLQQVFSPDTQSLSANVGPIISASWQVNSQVTVSALGVLILAVAVAILGGLQLFLTRTRWGREMRATAQDPDTAQLVGINARAVYARATAIALAVAMVAGLFLGIRSNFSPTSGPTQLIFAFEAVVIGGLESPWGTLVGGVILGLAQSIGEQIDPAWSLLAGHLVFLAVLAVRGGGYLAARRAEA